MQIAQVKKVLASVAEICGAGDSVVFDEEAGAGSYMETKRLVDALGRRRTAVRAMGQEG